MHIPFPPPAFRTRESGGRRQVFDVIRKRWVALTPEEWVRQNFIAFLLHVMRYPGSLLSVEKGLMVGELGKRCDVVVYHSGAPWMIIECKEMEVALNEKTAMQIFAYNMKLGVHYLVVTNGRETFVLDTKTGQSLHDFPAYPSEEKNTTPE